MPLTLDGLSVDSLKELCADQNLEVVAKSKAELKLMLGTFLREQNKTLEQLLAPVVVQPVAAVAAAQNVPLPLQLSQPPHFDMHPVGREQRWRQWLDDFVNYLDALGPNVPDQQRKALLIHCAGQPFSRFVKTIAITPTATESRFDALVRTVTERFSPIDTHLYEQYQLGDMTQNIGDTTDDYVVRLRDQARSCDLKCPHCTESLEDWCLTNVLIRHTNVHDLRKRVFERGLRDLEPILALARSMEVANQHSQAIASSSAVNLTKPQNRQTVDRDSQSGPPQFSGKPQSNPPPRMCKFCGQEHPLRAKLCPAYGKTCNSCKQQNHFSNCCPNSAAKKKPTVYTACAADTQDDGDPHIFHLEGKSQAFASVVIEGVQREVQIDTGSTGNVIPKSFLSGRYMLRKAAPLSVFGKSLVMPLGTALLSVGLPGKKPIQRNFTIVENGEGPALLGLRQSLELGFVSFNPDTVYTVRPAETIASPSEVAASPPGIDALVTEFDDLFQPGFTPVRGHKAHIQLREGVQPRFRKARAVPLALRKKVEVELGKMMERGTLKPVRTSAWASPMVSATKGDGGIRLCADYTSTLANVIDVEMYPLPHPEQIFAQLAGGKFFTRLDLRCCYEQFELDDASKEILTVNTIRGLLQYQRLPYGISSGPAIVQRAMEGMFHDMSDVSVFIDDILLVTHDLAAHLVLLKKVFQRLRETGIHLKKDKCLFAVKSLKYLGFILSENGRSQDPEKIAAIVEMASPRSVSELQSFLGMIRFYERFVEGMADKAAPLYQLLKKNSTWHWSEVEQTAFETLKKALISAPTLCHFDPDKPVVLSCDASPHGVGAVLSHRVDGKEYPIAYASRSLSAAERNYAQIDREALGIMFGVCKFHSYLWGRKFTLVTDHKPLVAIFGCKKGLPELVTARMHRYAIRLSSFDFVVEHRKGINNGNADALSRIPLPTTGNGAEDRHVYLVRQDVSPLSLAEIQEETRNDAVLSDLMNVLQVGVGEACPKDAFRPFWKFRQSLSIENNLLFMGDRIVLPSALQRKYLDELHSVHQGITRMKALARNVVWWPNLGSDLENLVAACALCQSCSASPTVVTENWPVPSHAWDRVHLDYFSFRGQDYLLLVDAASKWIEVSHMRSTTSMATLRKLYEWFTRFGFPKAIHTDGGPQFTSAEFREKMDFWGVDLTVSPAYHPQSNGLAERAVRTIKSMLEKNGTPKLEEILFRYRSTPQTGSLSPSEMLMGRKLRTRLCIKDAAKVTNVRCKFNVGESVWSKNVGPGKRYPRWFPAVVQHVDSNMVLTLVDENTGKIFRRHVNQIRRRLVG